MKILMLSDVYFPRINGVATSIASFREALMRLGHEVVLICPEYKGNEEEQPGIWRVASRQVPHDPEDRIMRYRHVMALTRQLDSQRFDIIHIHTPFIAHYAGIALGKRLGVPVVATYHTLFEEYLHHYVRWLPQLWLRFAARRLTVHQCDQLDALIVPSRIIADTLQGYGVKTEFQVISTGLAPDLFTQPTDETDFRQRYGLPDKAPLLLFVGRAAFEKNICFLIDMLPEVLANQPDARLIITGEGPALESLKRQARDKGVAESVMFIGYLGRSGALQDAYRAADVFVFASRTETQGLVLLEAMAMGTPVISTAVMGTREVLIDGEGCLIAEDDRQDFARKVQQLLNDKPRRDALGERGRRYAATWHEDIKTAELMTFYQQLATPYSPDN